MKIKHTVTTSTSWSDVILSKKALKWLLIISKLFLNLTYKYWEKVKAAVRIIHLYIPTVISAMECFKQL